MADLHHDVKRRRKHYGTTYILIEGYGKVYSKRKLKRQQQDHDLIYNKTKHSPEDDMIILFLSITFNTALVSGNLQPGSYAAVTFQLVY